MAHGIIVASTFDFSFLDQKESTRPGLNMSNSMELDLNIFANSMFSTWHVKLERKKKQNMSFDSLFMQSDPIVSSIH